MIYHTRGNMKKISVIVPIHTVRFEYLKECVESLLCQTLKEIEILLIFNGASAELIELCEREYKNNPTICIFKLENSGVSMARNYGIRRSTGQYVMFCDADDWFAYNVCEKTYNAIEKDGSDMLIFNYICVIDGKNYNNPLYKKPFIRNGKKCELIYFGNICKKLDPELNKSVLKGIGGCWNRIYRRDLLIEKNINFPENCSISEDVIFNLYATAYSVKVSYLPFDGYYYRINEESATFRFDSSIFDHNLPYYREVNNFLEEKLEGTNYNRNDIMNAVIINGYIRAAEQIWIGTRHDRTLRKHGIQIWKKKRDEWPYKAALHNISWNLLSLKQKVAAFVVKQRIWTLFQLMLYIKNR